MRIGVDVDGVLTNIEQFELDYGSEYYINYTNKHLTNPKGYGSCQIFEGTEKEDNLFWRTAIYEYLKEPPRKFASKVLELLKNCGHEIYIITNRISDLSYCDITQEQMRKIILKWLKKHKIYYDKLIFSNRTKLDALKENKIDIMIEDNPKNIKEQSEEIKVLCFDARYNSDIEKDNVIRVYSWFDILDKIRSIDKY